MGNEHAAQMAFFVGRDGIANEYLERAENLWKKVVENIEF